MHETTLSAAADTVEAQTVAADPTVGLVVLATAASVILALWRFGGAGRE